MKALNLFGGKDAINDVEITVILKDKNTFYRMQKAFYILCLMILCCSCSSKRTNPPTNQTIITKLELDLSALGVESDHYPSIYGTIDFNSDTSYFIKSYYNPSIKGATYRLKTKEIKTVLALLQHTDLNKLKLRYEDERSDLPTSTITIYTQNDNITISDYGLKGESPLPDIYKLCYKF